jgi:rhomboid protease GluP
VLHRYKLRDLQEAQATLRPDQFKSLMLEIAATEAQFTSAASAIGVARGMDTVVGNVRPVTGMLLATIWIVFALESLQPGGSTDSGVLYQFGATTADVFSTGQLWRLIANCFVHIGLVHLMANSMALLWLGNIAERMYGRLRCLGMYLAAGIGGSIVSVMAAGPAVISAGASGAIWGLLGALLVGSWSNRRAMSEAEGRALRSSLRGTLMLSAAISFLPGVDLAAHVGGFITGVALGLVIPYCNPCSSRARSIMANVMSGALVGLAVLLMLTGAAGH